ncbi:hypothetical protein ACLOJK_020122 [Asimina triloba]
MRLVTVTKKRKKKKNWGVRDKQKKMQRSPVSPPRSKIEESSSSSSTSNNVGRSVPRDEIGVVVRHEKPSAALKRIEHRAEDINECAEAFIQRFRHQLHIQRLESIENYEQMLARGL